jgi:RNA polymerase sigma-70 factor (ECF subfamily)
MMIVTTISAHPLFTIQHLPFPIVLVRSSLRRHFGIPDLVRVFLQRSRTETVRAPSCIVEGTTYEWIETLTEAAAILDSGTSEQALESEFEQRLADCATLAYRVALGVLRNHAEAEDAAQEAFVRAYHHFAELRDRDHFKAWLVRTSWRLAIDRQRSAARRDRREQTAHESGTAGSPQASTVEQTALGREFHERIDRAVDALPEDLRRVVILAAIEGYDMRETAALLEIPEGTVRSRLHRARKMLAEKLR